MSINDKIAELCDTPDPKPVTLQQLRAEHLIATQQIIINELQIENRRLQAELKKSSEQERGTTQNGANSIRF